MDPNDQRAIEALFDKLAAVERKLSPRDHRAEAYIRERITEQPSAPYYMAQTIVAQEKALQAAGKRIEELEAGGTRQSMPSVSRPQASGAIAGPGFLAGAAQTALGVTGGVLLGSFISELLKGDHDHSTGPEKGDNDPAGHNDSAHDTQLHEARLDDDGDFGDGDFGDIEV